MTEQDERRNRERVLEERQAMIRFRMQETCKLDPTTPLTLGNDTFVLIYNNWAMKRILEDTGLNLLREPLVAEHYNDPNVLGSVILRGVQTKHPEVTLDQVDRLFSIRHLLYVRSQVATAMSLFYPDLEDLPEMEPEEKTDEDPSLRPAVTGSATGQLDAPLDSPSLSSGAALTLASPSSSASESLSGMPDGTSSPPNS